MDNSKDVRWKQRFQNFDKAFVLLRSAFDDRNLEDFSDLEQEGIIQRFEFTFELAWKTIKDYLQDNGVIRSTVCEQCFEESINRPANRIFV